jgi:hypothetical protein
MQILFLIALNSHYVKTCSISNIHIDLLHQWVLYGDTHKESCYIFYEAVYSESCYGLLNTELHTWKPVKHAMKMHMGNLVYT